MSEKADSKDKHTYNFMGKKKNKKEKGERDVRDVLINRRLYLFLEIRGTHHLQNFS